MASEKAFRDASALSLAGCFELPWVTFLLKVSASGKKKEREEEISPDQQGFMGIHYMISGSSEVPGR